MPFPTVAAAEVRTGRRGGGAYLQARAELTGQGGKLL